MEPGHDDGYNPDSVVILRRESHRIELHIKRMGSSWLLVGLSGDEAKRADNIKLQGPFGSHGLVESMTNAISAVLSDRGYGRFDDSEAIWTLQAVAESRVVYERRARNDFDHRANPDTNVH